MIKRYASNVINTKGRLIKEDPDNYKDSFHRDRDRILCSAPFRRLQYKTQVFTNNEGDHYRTRLTHSLEVAQIARTICRSLNLCEDLSEAIALAHDIGHAPFGHAGEDALNEAMQDYGGFSHNNQTFKIITRFDCKYAKFGGLNLTWETLEGVAKHNGPVFITKNNMHKYTSILDFSNKFDLDLNNYTSLEAQVASLADDIAYNNHDIEDGVRAGLVTKERLLEIDLIQKLIRRNTEIYKNITPSQLIHETVRAAIKVMIDDVIMQTKRNIKYYNIETSDDVRQINAPIVDFSSDMKNANKEIKQLLKTDVYNHYKVNRMTYKARRITKKLFNIYMDDPSCLPTSWKMKVGNINNKIELATIVADFISGMTDRFALKEYVSFFNLATNETQL